VRVGTAAVSRAGLRGSGRIAWQRFRRRAASAGIPTWALVIGGLALLVRLPLFFGEHNVPRESDNEYFLYLADGLLDGEGFRGHLFWTPGYPAFIASLQLLPGRVEDALTIAQHLLGVLVVVVILVATWRYFGKGAALVAAALAALTPILVVHEHTVLPDFLFGLLVLTGALALAEACRRQAPDLRLLVLAGVVFGLAAWVKPAGQFLFAAAPLALLFSTRSASRAMKGSLVMALAMLLTISPWLLRNTVLAGFPSMSNQAGASLLNRAFDTGDLPIPTDSEYSLLASRAKAGVTPDVGHQMASRFIRALKRVHGLTSDEALEVELEMALTAIRRNPGAYLESTLRRFGQRVPDINRYEGSAELLAELDRSRPPVPRALVDRVWDVARVATDAWWLLSLHTLAGLLVLFVGAGESRNAGAALLSVWLVVSLGTVLADPGLWRYSVQVAPIAWMLGSAGIVILVSSVWMRLASQRPMRGS
jgi:4-amino-4-deoxy-L-arabinose transferase-like glycosyltransferase